MLGGKKCIKKKKRLIRSMVQEDIAAEQTEEMKDSVMGNDFVTS